MSGSAGEPREWVTQVNYTLSNLERRLGIQATRTAELSGELLDLIERVDALAQRLDRVDSVVRSLDQAAVSHFDAPGHTPNPDLDEEEVEPC
jgi:hypothetical protein